METFTLGIATLSANQSYFVLASFVTVLVTHLTFTVADSHRFSLFVVFHHSNSSPTIT